MPKQRKLKTFEEYSPDEIDRMTLEQLREVIARSPDTSTNGTTHTAGLSPAICAEVKPIVVDIPVLPAPPRAPPVKQRSQTLPMKGKKKAATNADIQYDLTFHHKKPKTYGECIERVADAPCPYVSCRHNLYLDVKANGNIKINFPHLELEDMPETCSIRAAMDRPRMLHEVAELMNITRERGRQLEVAALERLSHLADPWDYGNGDDDGGE